MVAIRLSRFGKKSHPTFRVVVSDRQKDTVGKYLEQVGTYNPHSAPAVVEFNIDRVQYWLSVGAQPSATVHNLLVEKGVIQAPKVVVSKAKKVEVPAETAPAAEKPAEATAAADKPVETVADKRAEALKEAAEKPAEAAPTA